MQQPPSYQPQPQPAVYPPQPGQTNVIVGAPVQSSSVVQAMPVPQEEGCCSGTSLKFNMNGGMITGILQLIIAILCIALAGASYAFPYAWYYPACGIWSGLLFFMPAGILGIFTKNRNTCVIVAYLVMSILSTLQSFGMSCYEGVFAGVYTLIQVCHESCIYYSNPYNCPNICNGERNAGLVAIHSVLAILAFAEFIISIVGSALCCGGLRCCCASPTPSSTTTTTTTVYYNTQPGQVPVGQYLPTENKV